MSGHSKWHNIAKKKGAADAKRGKEFSKLAKAISVAARSGGADQAMNFALRLAVEKAKQVNMPKENIERAIARGVGDGGNGLELSSAVYEAIGPGGVAMLVEVLTDNTNRSATNVRNILNKNGANPEAKVMWQFERKGVVRVEDVSSILDRDALELSLIDVGAQDISWDGGLDVAGDLSDLQTLEKTLSTAGLNVSSAEPEYVAKEHIELSQEDGERLGELIEALEGDDDVQNVYTNAL